MSRSIPAEKPNPVPESIHETGTGGDGVAKASHSQTVLPSFRDAIAS
jgi:hypothetical protein